MIFVVTVAPVDLCATRLDGILVKPPIAGDFFRPVPVWPPAEVAALQNDIRLLFIGELVQRPEVGVNVPHDDNFHFSASDVSG